MYYAPFMDVRGTLSSGIQNKSIILPVKDLYIGIDSKQVCINNFLLCSLPI